MKAPFIFRPQTNFVAVLAALFAAQRFQERDIDPPKRNHQGTSSGHPNTRKKTRLSKRERQRRQQIRMHTKDRKH